MIDLTFSPTQLRACRDAAGLTREHVAYHASCSVRAIANWEAGDTTPQADVLATLASIYRCEIGDFYVHDEDGSRADVDSPEVQDTKSAPPLTPVPGRS